MTEPTTKRHPGRPAIARTEQLTLDAILEAAHTLVRADGLDALSFRHLATALGVTPSAIYRYVPDKAGLVEAMVDQVWLDVVTGMPWPVDDPVEWCIQTSLRMRRIWLDNLELAHYATAVVDPDTDIVWTVQYMRTIMRTAGFPDVPESIYAVQTLTMGSVTVAATRARSSRYFGRDPDETWREVRRQLDQADPDPELAGMIDARFDIGDERHFERVLRRLVRALLLEPDEPT